MYANRTHGSLYRKSRPLRMRKHKHDPMTVSLIISTYNWPQALALCLESVMRQQVLPTEILIADDGSGPATREVVERFSQLAIVPLRHIWQEDEGFRVGRIRNKAIAASRCDYIVQIDGDMLLDEWFIHDHIAFARHGCYATGSRGYMTKPLTRRIMARETTPSFFSRGLLNRNNVLRIPLFTGIYRLLGLHRRARGCNLAFWREDLIRINGYDEAFNGWGWEDTDLAARLTNSGVRQQCIRFSGIGYHLCHPHCERPDELRNKNRCMQSMQHRTIRCLQGLDQHL